MLIINFIHFNLQINLHFAYFHVIDYSMFSAIADHKNGRQFNHVFVKFCDKFMRAANGNDINQTSRLVDIMISTRKRISRHIQRNNFDMFISPYQCIYRICFYSYSFPSKVKYNYFNANPTIY